MKENKKSVSYGIRYNSINGISTVLSRLFRGLVIPKILGPLSFGLFGSIALFTRYLYLFDFGSPAYFFKEIAKLDYEKKSERYLQLVSQTFSILIFGVFLSSLVLMALGFTYRGENSDFYTAAIFLTIPTYALTKVREYYMLFLAGTGQYRKFSLLKILENWVLLIFVSVGVYLYGALGGVSAMLMSEIILVSSVLSVVDLRPRFHLDFSVLRKIKLYLDQYLIQITEMIAVTADQVLLLFIFGPIGFGLYILGLSIAWIYEALSEVINNAFYPKIMKASVSSKDDSINVLQLSICMYLIASALFVPGAVVGLNWLILGYFSDYESGLDIFFILLFFGISRGGLALLKKGYIATNKERMYIGISMFSIVMNCVFAIYAYISELSLNNAVYSLSIINLIVYSIYYLLLVSTRHVYYFLNIILILGLFLALTIIQMSIRDLLSGFDINIFFAITISLYTLPVSLAWHHRKSIAEFLNRFVSVSNG
ncbi:hypothetical protein OAK61_01700 [Gammaproteobacteria bacterium]|nr:hypothetical protein [Gammaproteobacteria bacterium]